MSKRRQRRRSRVCLHVAEIAAPFRSQGLGGEACDIGMGVEGWIVSGWRCCVVASGK